MRPLKGRPLLARVSGRSDGVQSHGEGRLVGGCGYHSLQSPIAACHQLTREVIDYVERQREKRLRGTAYGVRGVWLRVSAANVYGVFFIITT